MSASTFAMHVPVDKITVVKGPGLSVLEEIEYVYSSEEGIDVTLTLKTSASDRTFERKVRAWDYCGQNGFRLLLDGWNRWCEYDHKTRNGEIDIEHPDDQSKREIQEGLADSAVEIARFQAGFHP